MAKRRMKRPLFLFYKERPYWLIWRGKTKYGERVHLGFLDGTKTFWVAAEDTVEPGKMWYGGECPMCGAGRLATGQRIALKMPTRRYDREHCWCREVLGFDERGGLAMRFLRGQTDVLEDCRYYWLCEGRAYEISEPGRRRPRRYFAIVRDGELEEVQQEELEEWLKSALESTC